jgi:single-strand DNA-binding protein
MNKVMLLGRLTKSPEIRYTQANAPVSAFTLAVDRRGKKDNEKTADFINVTAFGTLADTCNKYLEKGKQIEIVGRIQTRNWDDDQGQKHFATDVIAEEMYFTGSSKQENKQEGTGDTITDNDDLPF